MADTSRSQDFSGRHIGPTPAERRHMLDTLGVDSLDALIKAVVPDSIRQTEPIELSERLAAPLDEATALAELREMSERNVVVRSLLGQGYHDCHLPAVIQRNVLENPSWYTAYTPYQPEIAQGRLEALFNFQTLVTELTALPIANASLLDEATAAAEAMALAHRALRGKRNLMLVAEDCHPQTIDVMQTRATPLGLELAVVSVGAMPGALAERADEVFAALIQYPGSTGAIPDPKPVVAAVKDAGAMMLVACDLLALTLLSPPGEWGADIVIGSAQRFGVPMGFGGPHAAFMATTEAHKRSIPGRLVGQSVAADGKPAYRLALQTREQHIRREKATSNICTAQALLAIIATLYACHHGPAGLTAMARRIRGHLDRLVNLLGSGSQSAPASSASGDAVQRSLISVRHARWFDTITLTVDNSDRCVARVLAAGYNLRRLDDRSVCLSLDETTRAADVTAIANALLHGAGCVDTAASAMSGATLGGAESSARDHDRAAGFLSQACFHDYHSETEMMRYLKRLAAKDIALDQAMIPLGSCTMKLNAAAEMVPVSWPAFSRMHPFAPTEQTMGYQALVRELEIMLCACTGYDAMSLQPNAGSQGEYAGLLAIRRYHAARGESHRDVCLIPESAHGTNPASAQMAGLQVVVVACDDEGNIDHGDLDQKLGLHEGRVAAIMITYPSTHGVFEAGVRSVCERVHAAGGQVYIDGANLNAMVGTARPGKFGGDVSHLNLHKTFCIPHGGGGPGVGPIGVGSHLEPYLPGHRQTGDAEGVVSAAPWGSALILPITWMYIRMMGSDGLKQATEVAILSANYIAARLSPAYPILYRGKDRGEGRNKGRWVAHECILDTRTLKLDTGITVDDIAKRLMDYGFHAPTMSFPVAGTLMVEPTESESLAEIDRFCDAMLAIHAEALRVKAGDWPTDDNPLINAPHTLDLLTSSDWTHPYTREEAASPAGQIESGTKYWPPVRRIDNVHGDKHLICSCPPMSTYETGSGNPGACLSKNST